MGVGDSGGILIDRYIRALAFFGEQVVAVPDGAWEDATPSGDWNLRSVVAHVVVGESQTAAGLRGKPTIGGDQIDSGVLGSNPVAAWRGTALAAIEAARTHPDDVEVLGRRITENLVHGWDVATASSRVVVIPDDLAQWTLDFWLPRLEELRATEEWGPMLEPATDAEPGDRLLALAGRSSLWSADTEPHAH